MRISVNLATRPFVELRPFFLRLRLLMGLLVVVGASAVIGAHLLQVQVDQAQAQMDVYSTRTLAAQQEKQANERRMRQPMNAEVLDRAHFLNTLFLRKSFSWTAVMMDLERVLPIGVQVTSIEPQISSDGDVVIRLRVSGDRDRTVQLVRNLEGSRRFLHPRLTGESQQAKEGQAPGSSAAAAAASSAPAGVEFEILANYNPLPEGQSYATVKTVAARSGAGAVTSPVRRKNPGIVLKPYGEPHVRTAKPVPGGVR
jgi:type IV pilus assembly protein PilN